MKGKNGTDQFFLYQTEDGQTRIDVRLEDETVWLSQMQLADLFQKSKKTISEHVQNIFKEGELIETSVVRNFRTTASDGKEYLTKLYNLDVIISVGYRVKSHRGTQFRIWATQRLREYIIKGYTMDDQRLKQAGNNKYFDELLARIRDIRSSEKMFWQKVLAIYATSIDYSPNVEASKQFFKVIQNKMHWAAHGHTAAEIIMERADASKQNMGLTTWTGDKLMRTDSAIAKNYLNDEELSTLNRLVSMYLDFAELQALNRQPMHMQDWLNKLDDFMKLTGRESLTHAGKITHQQAIDKAYAEYDKYSERMANVTTSVEQHFIEAIQMTNQLEKAHQTSESKSKAHVKRTKENT